MAGITSHDLLASAIAGRKVSVQLSREPDALAFSDGQHIVLAHDGSASSAGDVPDLPPWLPVAAQATLIAAGSLEPALLRQLIGRRQAAQRYVWLEVMRASQLCQERLPWRYTQRPELQSPRSASAAASLALAIGPGPLLPAPPRWFGTVRPLRVLRRALSEDGLAALTGKQQQSGLLQHDVKALAEDDEGESSALLKLFQNPFSARNPVADLLNEILGAGVSKGQRERDPGAGGGDEMRVGRVERSMRRGIHAVRALLSREVPELDAGSTSQALYYPEWDVHAQAYRRDWVSVEEVEAWRPDGPQDLHEVLRPPSRELRRQLSGLGLDHELHRRQQDGADLDTGALIDAAIELRAGHSPPSMNVYRASRRTRRDLAVVVALDISGSTGEHDAPGDSVFKKHLRLAHQLVLTLDALGDTVAAFGFHSWGRKQVRAVHLKGHEERWSARVAERLALLEPVGYTRTGAAVRHGARMLGRQMGLPNRLLVLITDGIVYDQDYEESYAEGDARRSLEEARAAGTACICLSVGSGTDINKLAHIFGVANVLAVDEVEQVTGRIRELCRRALTAVARHSR